MLTLSTLLILYVALSHVCFLILEMFVWNKPLGLKIFKMTQEVADASAVLAKNQGLYNGFLAAGLFWSLSVADPVWGLALQHFFLGCVVVAGLYGALTAAREIFFLQALPAILALAALRLS